MKSKNIFAFFSAVTMFVANVSFPAYAAEEKVDPYYVTIYGYELTEEQYNNLKRGFSETAIYTMPDDIADIYKNDKTLYTVSTNYYVKTDIEYIEDEIISETDTLVSREEYDSVNKASVLSSTPNYSPCSGLSKYETTYKKITITVGCSGSISRKSVTLTTNWKIIPSVKSYDVMVIAPGKTSMQLPTDGTTKFYGSQKYNDKTINYNSTSGNFKVCNKNGLLKSGVGLSTNISDSATRDLQCSMTVFFYNNDSYFPVYGSYQHATKNVTLSQSQNYEINVLGMGGVILFDEDVAGYYDDTKGVIAEYYQ